MAISPPLWKVQVRRLVKASKTLLEKFNGNADAIEELRETVSRDRIVVGLNLTESQTPDGRKLDAKLGSADGAETDSPKPFTILDASNGGDNPGRARIITSTLAGDVPDGFNSGDTPPFYLTVADGDIIYGHVIIDNDDGTITTREILAAATLPADIPSTGEYYVRLGSVDVVSGVVTPVNDRFGPIDVDSGREWFAFPKQFWLEFRP